MVIACYIQGNVYVLYCDVVVLCDTVDGSWLLNWRATVVGSAAMHAMSRLLTAIVISISNGS